MWVSMRTGSDKMVLQRKYDWFSSALNEGLNWTSSQVRKCFVIHSFVHSFIHSFIHFTVSSLWTFLLSTPKKVSFSPSLNHECLSLHLAYLTCCYIISFQFKVSWPQVLGFPSQGNTNKCFFV